MLTPLLRRRRARNGPRTGSSASSCPSAGGATDFLGRALASELGKRLKQNVIVENRAGAGGSVGAQAVALSPADGYTLLLASGSMFTVNQYIYGKLPYSLDNFSLVGKVASGPMVVTVNAGLPVKNIRELIAYAQARPGKLNSSAGVGSQTHMAGEAFSDAAGVKLVHVPYKGEGPAYSDLMAGVVEVAVANINAITPLRATACARWPSRAGSGRAVAGRAHRGRGGRARFRIHRLVRADGAGGNAAAHRGPAAGRSQDGRGAARHEALLRGAGHVRRGEAARPAQGGDRAGVGPLASPGPEKQITAN